MDKPMARTNHCQKLMLGAIDRFGLNRIHGARVGLLQMVHAVPSAVGGQGAVRSSAAG
ncbi:hypothetical protein [Streptomyces sp. NPDC053560]|uniref:hypothetical protein n=1 Tax=Streptomyces sp. NPDC053560 TaxID=3365711 RepID=UPI0037D657AB